MCYIIINNYQHTYTQTKREMLLAGAYHLGCRYGQLVMELYRMFHVKSFIRSILQFFIAQFTITLDIVLYFGSTFGTVVEFLDPRVPRFFVF